MKIALIGYGYWGKIAARAIARTGELSWIVEKDAATRHQASTDWEPWGTRVSDDLAHAAAYVDAVWVATPTSTHFLVVQDALNLGLHVLCEKPFVTDSSEALHLARLAEDAERALMVGHLTIHSDRQVPIRIACQDQKRSVVSAYRRNTQASLSDGSVLFGVGPHEVAPWVEGLGVPDDLACSGTLHRVVFSMRWATRGEGYERVKVDVELDWLAETRSRMMHINGKELSLQETQEPLLREARRFVQACRHPEVASIELRTALATTRTLEELEHLRTNT